MVVSSLIMNRVDGTTPGINWHACSKESGFFVIRVPFNYSSFFRICQFIKEGIQVEGAILVPTTPRGIGSALLVGYHVSRKPPLLQLLIRVINRQAVFSSQP